MFFDLWSYLPSRARIALTRLQLYKNRVKIPIRGHEFVLQRIKFEDFAMKGAWIVYPVLGLLFKPWVASYAVVCSTWHFLVARDLKDQIGMLYFPGDREKGRFKIVGNEILVERKHFTNFWWNSYKPKVSIAKEENRIPYVMLTPEQREIIDLVLARRKTRFRAVAGGVLIGGMTYVYFLFKSIGLFNGVLFSLALLIPNYASHPTELAIDSSYPFCFVDKNGNLGLTFDEKGYRKRMKVKKLKK